MFRVPYRPENKIKIIFIFQAASFWPSWESFWEACQQDDRFDVQMYVCDDPIKEQIQFKSARAFLDNLGIKYAHISTVNLDELKPDVVVLHTPYDGGHRPKYLHGNRLTASGYRVIYITYGIEISDTDGARSDHFTASVTTTAWRVYTFSQEMIPLYKKFSPTGGDMVRAIGHPKFDGLVGGKFNSFPEDINNLINGRKVVLWKVHFPKIVAGHQITPSINEYLQFAKNISQYEDLFFIFMPHPKFYEQLEKFANVSDFRATLDSAENVHQYFEDDYRAVLLNCDFYMIDRSALMIEAGVTGRPILYLHNNAYDEPMTPPVQHIIDSYYKAHSYEGMDSFIQDVIYGEDYMKIERDDAFHKIIPFLDGNNGERIKEDIITSIMKEK